MQQMRFSHDRIHAPKDMPPVQAEVRIPERHLLHTGLRGPGQHRSQTLIALNQALEDERQFGRRDCRTQKGSPVGPLYQKARSAGIIDGACKACSAKMGVLDAIRAENLPFLDEMGGHPSMGRYLENGYEVITF
jgi:hypothetical protein